LNEKTSDSTVALPLLTDRHMGTLISLTLWRSANSVRCELIEQQTRQSFEVRLIRGAEVLKFTEVRDTDTAYRVATAWRSEYHPPAPDATQPLEAVRART
jgi:hypothetical protein